MCVCLFVNLCRCTCIAVYVCVCLRVNFFACNCTSTSMRVCEFFHETYLNLSICMSEGDCACLLVFA